VLFVERANEFYSTVCLSVSDAEAQGNQVLIGRIPQGDCWVKTRSQGELAMTRLNPAEMRKEDRTG